MYAHHIGWKAVESGGGEGFLNKLVGSADDRQLSKFSRTQGAGIYSSILLCRSSKET